MLSVPKYYDFYNSFLASLSDGCIHSKKDCDEFVRQKMRLSPEDLSVLTASGYSLWVNRVGWCATYLKKAGLVESPKRAFFQITEEGKRVLAMGVTISDGFLAEKYPAFAEFKRGNKGHKPEEYFLPEPEQQETPLETLERVYTEIDGQLSEELLSAILTMPPIFFERLVVRLMEGLGYGGFAGAGFITKASGDSGIDGIIHEDRLGFNSIYIQAKRWDPTSTVGRPEIQKFAGALLGPPKIEKGVYITTAKFSKEAEDYARAQHIILVNGKKLTELMIKSGIGVSTIKTYEIKRVDSDFFEDE